MRNTARSRRRVIEQAIQDVRGRFPFPGYADSQIWAYFNIAATVLRYLPPGAKVLDFGCGPGDKTAVIQALGFECAGYDDLKDPWHKIEENQGKILRFMKDFGIQFTVAGDGSLPYEKESFDMVMMHDVLEHLHDSPRDLVNDLLECVVPGGYLFVTVPNAVNIRKRIAVLRGRTNLPEFSSFYWYPGPWRGHVREYTKGDLVQLATYLDLDIAEIRSCNHMLGKVPAVVRPLYLALTSIVTGWRDSWLLVAKKRAGWKARKTLAQEEFDKLYGPTLFGARAHE